MLLVSELLESYLFGSSCTLDITVMDSDEVDADVVERKRIEGVNPADYDDDDLYLSNLKTRRLEVRKYENMVIDYWSINELYGYRTLCLRVY